MSHSTMGLALAALLMACGGSAAEDRPSPATPTLSGSVYVIDGTVFVANEDTVLWLFPRIEVNGAYRAGVDLIQPGARAELPLREFADADGTRFDLRTMKPLDVCVSAEQPGSDTPGRLCGSVGP